MVIPEYEEKKEGSKTLVDCYVELRNQTEFDYVVRLLSIGLSFIRDYFVVDANRDLLGTWGGSIR